MILRYGNYSHDDCEAKIAIQRRSSLTRANVPFSYTEQWAIELLVVGDDVTDVTTKLLAIEAAYKIRGVDCRLLTSAGGATAHKMLHADTIGGVRVVSLPSYPTGEGAEYTTYRTVTIVLEADFPINPGDPGTQFLDWQETVETFGGGPLLGYTAPINGVPVRQTIRQRTTFKATQSGSAVGYLGYPAIPGPLFPGALMENPRITRSAPRRNGTSAQEFPVSWSYVFESPSPLFGTPNIQPA